ncbi:small ribosomal subunit protein mS29 [Tribolium castaneum]|uniref:Small ribosomal subunit protein mS29 n=1 Tax=Tribolium castaneum TaxID=7070 RepID=D6WFH0_TRICA|nr:PREDICTED: 28S ribosomal protein S29, mitochondrial [Tribolium castaneum]EFA00920.1 28S ribosomal protein S29, mitochondrial-like Protein [Tribolium castaneum]|eukprot:XP_967654.1 PREDICTED: 28S ribosomal protein S29, mitochondrial [Tribolium castaneum]
MIKSGTFKSLLRRHKNVLHFCQLSSAAQPQSDPKSHSFRTDENDPLKHTLDHVGQYYRVPQNECKVYLYGGLPKSYEIQTKTFNETCLMVRKPSVDIINCLKGLDYTKPAVRFVLFGKKGSGKSLTMAHVLHYAQKAGFLLVHVPWLGNWMRNPKELSSSETREGFYDLNLDAAAWLVHFKSQNEHLLSAPELKTTREHVWSKRESTPKDSSLLELIDHGINRLKYASECVLALAEELKQLTKAGNCKTLVAIDGFNAFFYPKTRVFKEKKEVVPPNKITLTEAFLSLTKFDWNNAAIVVTVDEIAIAEEDHKSHFPRYLLGKEGFEHLDPFVPVFVDAYSPKELTSCMDYYRERKWVRYFPQQDEELASLSAYNPYKLMKLCISL